MTTRWVGGRSALLLAALLPAACMRSIDLSHPPVDSNGSGGGSGFDARPGNGGNGSFDSGTSDASRLHCGNGVQSITLNVQAELPAIMIALDRSPSMGKQLGSSSINTRFSVTSNALIGTMNAYPGLAQFGYVEFPGNDNNCTSGCCAGGFVPLITNDQGAPAQIVSQLGKCTSNQMIACTSSDATPTSAALKKIAQASSPGGPIDVILLTDGPPSCSDPSLPGAGDPCVQTVQELSDMATGRGVPTRIRTFVVAVGDVTIDDTSTTPPSNMCLSTMAGVSGHSNGMSPPFYYIANTETLVRSTVDNIVTSLICHLDISDTSPPFDPNPSRIEVDVNTSQIPNDPTQGWTLAGNGTRLDFAGAGCSSLISGLLKGISHHITVKACPPDSRTTPFPQPNP